MSIDPLASAIIGEPGAGRMTPELRKGVVTAVYPLLVRVGSATTSSPCAAVMGYRPAVGDAVSVLVLEGDRVVIGAVTAAGWPAPGTILGQQAYRSEFTSTMNASQDVGYQDPFGVFPFDTLAEFTASGLYLQPDRAHAVSAMLYSNAQASPAGGGTIFGYTGTTTSGATWGGLPDSLVATLLVPAGNDGPPWMLRLSGVTGGPTVYSFKGNIMMRRSRL